MPTPTVRPLLARCTALATAAALAATLAAQTPPPPVRIRLLEGGRVIEELPANLTPTPAPAAAPGDADANAAASELLKAWQAAKFDRRPATVLAEWAKPELKEYDPAEEKEKNKDKTKSADEPAAPEDPAAAIPDAVIPEGATEEEAQKLRDEVEAKRKAAVEAAAEKKEQELEQKRRQRRVEMAVRDVTLGRWDRVGAFLGTLAEGDRTKAYDHMLKGLAAPPPDPKAQQMPPPLQPRNAFAFEDVLALAGIAPGGLDPEEQLPLLVPLLQRALDDGNVLESWVALLQQEISRPEAQRRVDARRAALLLTAIGKNLELGPFLPTLDEAIAKDDREGLNLLARHLIAQHDKDKQREHLEQAWQATQAVLAEGEVTDEQKDEALGRAIELAPKIRKDLGPSWLLQSFGERPERGMEILAKIGTQVAQGFRDAPQDLDRRELGLRLQRAAVEALFAAAPDLADDWRPVLSLLASNWIAEAAWSYSNSRTTTMRPRLRRDAFGNLFYENRDGPSGPFPALEPNQLLEARPSDRWISLLEDSLVPHLSTVTAQLYLKVNEDAEAFPFIERLAETNPRVAKELADEFLRVWMRNHDPNGNNNTDVYMFIYGFDRRASGIPLTRSKQQRNLEELAGWVRRLRALPIDGVDEELLGQAFRTAHSNAEVYRLETIEQVFGRLGDLDPRMLGELLGTMRTNLATIWRRPNVQEEAKTKRSQSDIEREVMGGYQTALMVAEKAMLQHERHWALLTAQASLLHDMNNYRAELGKTSDFAEARQAAMALFEEAAATYDAAAQSLRPDQETTRVFETWFYGACGACDLGAIDTSTVLAESQLPKIKAALAALPGEQRERHLARFAGLVFTRMSAVAPAIKPRYLDAAFAILGDHPQAYEARKVYEYYKDLTGEIDLVARIDGPAEVGTEPFGVFVDLEHTVAIERESGGFQKYLQNQNSMAYAYNYGRPTEDYRDKFQEAAAQALHEHFEVLSLTFNADTATSISIDREGWRKTPYAYLLLRAKGPQVDKLPTLKIDLDFLDTTGSVILPIGSAPVALDATRRADAPRPFTGLELVETLDERKAEEGKLVLELKATARGLVPALDLVAECRFPGFGIEATDDLGVSVTKFTDDQLGVQSDRLWQVTLTAAEGAGKPEKFTFAKPLAAVEKTTYQRYADADLAAVGPEVELLAEYGHGTSWWPAVLGGAIAAAAAMAFLLWRRRRPRATAAGQLLHMPEQVTPFTVLVLLRQIAASPRLDAGARAELGAEMATVENHFFAKAPAQGAPPDLHALAQRWLHRAS
ncbi:MAG: hypothetical protein AB7O97_05865 [Planctomycetota bacterium]